MEEKRQKEAEPLCEGAMAPREEEAPNDKTIQILDENGKQATFVVSVKYRQNSTWQGKIQWMEGKKEQAFRSTLEMIKLMDNALSAGGDENFDGWEQS